MGGGHLSDETVIKMLTQEGVESFKLSLGQGVYGAKRRSCSFLQINLQVMLSMQRESCSLGLAEDISKVMVFSWDLGEIRAICCWGSGGRAEL